MHLGLNLIYLVPGETGGMEVVARELVPELRRAAPDWRFTAFINREAASAGALDWLEGCDRVTVPVRARSRMQWVYGEQVLLPRLAARAGVDLVHSLANTGPALGAFRRVVTIHDLIHRVHPEAHSRLRGLGMRVLVELAARRSHRVIADSCSTRDDLVRLFDLDQRRIDVVPLGVGVTATAAPTPVGQLRERLKLGARPVILSLSAKRPHKNLVRLIEALAALPEQGRPALVIPGYPTPHEADLRRRAAELRVGEQVRLPGWLPEADIEGLYALAAAFVFPSLYEGFGLPVLEAMRRGVPVACSNTSSLPEVAGDAALTFDPMDTRAISQALRRLLSEPDLVADLVERGRRRCGEFGWERAAAGTIASYERAVGREWRARSS
jgi:glycosyltransferase involved in cell wall biosynthesis